jgi:hypothetical protein
VLTIWFADSQFAVNTSFGKVELAADSVHKFTVAATRANGTQRPGLVGLWSGEDDGRDSVGGNDAELTDVTFADGKVGRAFSFNGFGAVMKVSDRLAANFTPGNGLTISVWFKPADVSGLHPMIQWLKIGSLSYGMNLRISERPEDQGVIYGDFLDAEHNLHQLKSSPGMVVNNTFQHAALTYDRASGQAFLYLNGVIVAQNQWNTPVPFGSIMDGFWVGRVFGDHPGDWSYNRFYSGLLDEISIYNRALSAAEIHEDYAAGNPD